jgi:hypothetical protein
MTVEDLMLLSFLKILWTMLDEEISQSTEYVMNELGLKMSDDTLLTHVTFHPIQKTSGRKIQLIYTISLQIGS